MSTKRKIHQVIKSCETYEQLLITRKWIAALDNNGMLIPEKITVPEYCFIVGTISGRLFDLRNK